MLIKSGEWETRLDELKLLKRWFQVEQLNQTFAQFREFKLRTSASLKVIDSHLMDQVEIDFGELYLIEKLDPDKFASAGSKFNRMTTNNHLYMVKKFTDSEIQEYIAAALFKRLLYDRAPIISIVRNHGIASKFFLGGKESLSIRDFYKCNGDFEYVLTHYEGIELILAAGMRLGDIDLNDRNILANKENADDREIRTLRKVDHGWALTSFFTCEGKMRKAFFKRFSTYLPFIDFNKLKDAILRCCSVSDEEIEDIVRTQIHRLKHQNLNTPFKFHIGIDDELSPKNDASFYSTIQFLTLDDYEKFILARLKMQRTVLQYMLKSLDLIQFLEPHVTKKQMIKLLQSIDPWVWAIQNNIYINGQHAFVYVQQNNLVTPNILCFQIDKYKNDPKLLCASLRPPKELVNEAVVIFCMDNEFKIHDLDPIEYAIENNLLNEEIVRNAAEKGLTIRGIDAFEYGVQNNMLFKGLHPIVYALNCDFMINEMQPFKFWDVQKKGHYHRSIFLEIITDEKHLALWDDEENYEKLEEVAKFTLFHGLYIYDEPALDFLDFKLISIEGCLPEDWVRSCIKKSTVVNSLPTNIGIW